MHRSNQHQSSVVLFTVDYETSVDTQSETLRSCCTTALGSPKHPRIASFAIDSSRLADDRPCGLGEVNIICISRDTTANRSLADQGAVADRRHRIWKARVRDSPIRQCYILVDSTSAMAKDYTSPSYYLASVSTVSDRPFSLPTRNGRRIVRMIWGFCHADKQSHSTKSSSSRHRLHINRPTLLML